MISCRMSTVSPMTAASSKRADLKRHTMSLGNRPRGVGRIERNIIQKELLPRDGTLAGVGTCQQQ